MDTVDGERYTITDYLGEGAFGVVWGANDTTNDELVALKQIKLEGNELKKSVIREMSIQIEMDHDNIVRLKRIFIEKDCLYLVMDRLDTTLRAHRSDMTSKYKHANVIKVLLKQILYGVQYSHSRGVLHRDLKMENILLNTSVGRVMIADFGSARGFLELKSILSPKVTTVNYRAPEVLLGEPYSTAIDMWSVGCIFAEMVTNKTLFPGGSEIQVLDKIYSMVGFDGNADARITALPGSRTVSIPPDYAKDLKSVLDATGFDLQLKLLQVNPNIRISAEAALEHDYLKEVDVADSREIFMFGGLV